jgi:uncharacterized protein YyaL (SSP411 family)
MNQDKNIEAEFSDSAYSSSLSILAQDFLRLATIIYDYEMYNKAKKIIQNGSYYINNYPLFYPSITKAYLMDKKGIYVLTTNQVLCNEFIYPYIEFKKGDNYELCTIQNCLEKTTEFQKIKNYIDK